MQGEHHSRTKGRAPAYDWPPHCCRHLLHLLQYCARLEICELLSKLLFWLPHKYLGKILAGLYAAGAGF